MISKKIILVTSGEPGGIGPDICLDLANFGLPPDYILVVLGDVSLLRARAKMLNRTAQIVSIASIEAVYKLEPGFDYVNKLIVLHVECPVLDTVGQLKVENASYVLKMLDQAIAICKSGRSNIIVTAPLSKEIINLSGYKFTGHTEYFAQAFACDKVVMMLANSIMKVALLTTHIPIKDVTNHITKDNLRKSLYVILASFTKNFGLPNPRIAVCGLNPHAGEGGYLGTEELEIINPVISEFKQNGYNVSGSYPADTIFTTRAEFDVILAMYHDQGLPVLKYSGFADGINITLGLPIIRTSVDHGTALDLAGSGKAFSTSLKNAVSFAIR